MARDMMPSNDADDSSDSPSQTVCTLFNEYTKEDIPLENLKLKNRHKYRAEQDDDSNALDASMRIDGQKTPIAVRRDTDGSFWVYDGVRRVGSAKRLGWESLTAFVIEDDEDTMEGRLIRNLLKKDLPDVVIAEDMAKLKAKHGYSNKQLADRFGFSKPAVIAYLKLANLPKHIKSSPTAL